jgi:membrane protein YdbS with pleckstrin-like domain
MARDVYDEWVEDDEELEDLKSDMASSPSPGPDPDPDEPDIPDPEPDPCVPDPEPVDPYTQDKASHAKDAKPGKVEFRIVGKGAGGRADDSGEDEDDGTADDGLDEDVGDGTDADGSFGANRGKTRTRIEDLGLVFKRSRISYLWNYFLVILLVALMALAWPVFHLTFSFAPSSFDSFWKSTAVLGFALLCFLLIEEPAIENAVRQYVVTNTEVMKIEGVLTKTRIIIPYQSVSDVVFTKTLLGRVFNFGDIAVTGFKNEILIKGVKNPETVYRIIQNKISMMRGGRSVDKKTVIIEQVQSKGAKGPAKKHGWRDRAKSLGARGRPKSG